MHRSFRRFAACLLTGAVMVIAVGAAAQAADPVPGKETYTRNCAACHGNGAAGAPRTGDKASWSPRIAQGLDVMAEHAINGYRGKSGYMPARGGFGSLTDKEVIDAVGYMAGESH